ncbi:hypothetical protein WG902_18310 [Ramlibacter sp. PS3R-8]|uniref:hypothetical protein n=1 Tax=Ramlibacter sp. PS3R-8 TaxID=3133437 RepID=UPI0030B737E9
MRSIWLLPDREQAGIIRVATPEGIVNLGAAFDVTTLPAAIVLGVPEPVLRENISSDFLFAQFARMAGGTAVFCLSRRAGQDVKGRTVCITNLQLLDDGEAPAIPPPVPRISLSEEDSKAVNALRARLAAPASASAEVVQELLNAVRLHRWASTFASADTPRNANPYSWTPKKKD